MRKQYTDFQVAWHTPVIPAFGEVEPGKFWLESYFQVLSDFDLDSLRLYLKATNKIKWNISYKYIAGGGWGWAWKPAMSSETGKIET